MKTSKIWTLQKDQLQKIVDESASYSDVLRKLDLSTNGASNHNRLKQRLKDDNINVSSIVVSHGHNVVCNSYLGNKAIPLEQVLVENSSYPRQSLKRRLIESDRLKYECALCGIDSWQGQKLVLRLDHKNGVPNDNREENLRLLCPNCDSQQDTYAGKNKAKRKRIPKQIPNRTALCKACGSVFEKRKRKQIYCCRECVPHDWNSQQSRKIVIEKEVLSKLLWEKPTVAIAKDFNVSDKAVEKLAKRYCLDKPPRGYWAKQQSLSC